MTIEPLAGLKVKVAPLGAAGAFSAEELALRGRLAELALRGRRRPEPETRNRKPETRNRP